MNWEQYRSGDGSLDLQSAFNDMTITNSKLTSIADGFKYVYDIVNLQPIKSRQLAAVILVDALRMSK
jgi:hypothetical protein